MEVRNSEVSENFIHQKIAYDPGAIVHCVLRHVNKKTKSHSGTLTRKRPDLTKTFESVEVGNI